MFTSVSLPGKWSARQIVMRINAHTVGGQNPVGVRGTPTITKKQAFGPHPGYEKEVPNMVIDQMIELNHTVAVGKT